MGSRRDHPNMEKASLVSVRHPRARCWTPICSRGFTGLGGHYLRMLDAGRRRVSAVGYTVPINRVTGFEGGMVSAMRGTGARLGGPVLELWYHREAGQGCARPSDSCTPSPRHHAHDSRGLRKIRSRRSRGWTPADVGLCAAMAVSPRLAPRVDRRGGRAAVLLISS